MKKVMFLSLALLMCMLCSAKKSVKKQVQEKNIQEIIDSLKNERDKHQAELEEIMNSVTTRPCKRPRPIEEIREEFELEFPCMSESFDTPDYYGGYGVAIGRTEQEAKQHI